MRLKNKGWTATFECKEKSESAQLSIRLARGEAQRPWSSGESVLQSTARKVGVRGSRAEERTAIEFFRECNARRRSAVCVRSLFITNIMRAYTWQVSNHSFVLPSPSLPPVQNPLLVADNHDRRATFQLHRTHHG